MKGFQHAAGAFPIRHVAQPAGQLLLREQRLEDEPDRLTGRGIHRGELHVDRVNAAGSGAFPGPER